MQHQEEHHSPVEEFVYVRQHQRVRVQKDTLGVLAQRPGSYLGERDAKLWPFQQRQVGGIARVERGDLDDLVEAGFQITPVM